MQNGTPIKAPAPGVWAPAITFFDHPHDTLDLAAQKKYYTYLSQSGLTGLVILGTNAETFLLTREERRQLIHLARDAVGPSYPLMAGVGGHSTAQVLEFIADAAAAKADYALLLPPAYFGKQTTNSVIESFFDDVAAKSPLPIVIYNFPGVCNGVDLDSELMTQLAKRHANIGCEADVRVRGQDHAARGDVSAGALRGVWRAVGFPHRRAECW